MHHLSKKTARRLTFIYLLTACGFVLGTLLLLGPVRWITTRLRASGSSQTIESATVLLAIGILIAASIKIASLLSSLATSEKWSLSRVGALLIPGVLALATAALWMNPRFIVQRVSLPANAQHVFIGPYPQGDDLARIKRKGYTAVISLLHPAVVPFEPKLIHDERIAAKRAGIRLIEVPMLPWVSGNADALEKIRMLAADTSARYYIHCYLGRDRVNVVRRALTQAHFTVSGMMTQSARSLDSVRIFERGAVNRLSEGVYLTPYPSDEEYFGYLIAGGVRTVVSLLDPTNPEDTLWIRKEKQLAANHGLRLVAAPLPESGITADRAAVIVGEMATLWKPVVIHGFKNPSPETIAIREAYERLHPSAGATPKSPVSR